MRIVAGTIHRIDVLGLHNVYHFLYWAKQIERATVCESASQQP